MHILGWKQPSVCGCSVIHLFTIFYLISWKQNFTYSSSQSFQFEIQLKWTTTFKTKLHVYIYNHLIFNININNNKHHTPTHINKLNISTLTLQTLNDHHCGNSCICGNSWLKHLFQTDTKGTRGWGERDGRTLCDQSPDRVCTCIWWTSSPSSGPSASWPFAPLFSRPSFLLPHYKEKVAWDIF